VKAYTEQFGAKTYIIGGVRKLRGKNSMSFFQPLSLVEIVSVINTRSAMERITEICWSPPFLNIPFDMARGTVAMFLSEVLYRSIREEEKNRTLFSFLHNSIQILDETSTDPSGFHIMFMVRLAKHLGIHPSGTWQDSESRFDLREGMFTRQRPVHSEYLSSEISSILASFIDRGFEGLEQISLTRLQRKELLEALVTYYEIHQTHGSRIRSHEVLREVLN
jgi:DNA repair protein RecO (recombination protein O)